MVPELRPRGIGELLDLAVVLYRRRLGRLLLVTLAVVLPVQIFSTLVLLSAQPDRFSPNLNGGVSPVFASGSAAVQLAAVVVILVANLIATTFVTAVCTRIVADTYVQHPEERGAAVRVATRRVFALTGLAVLVAMSQTLIAPIAFFAVATPVLVLEGTGVFRALGRSIELTKSHFLRVLGLVVTAQLLGALLSLGLAVGVAALFRNDDGSAALVITQGMANTIAAVLTTPLLASAIVACYFDLRIRNEAFDVQLLMQRNDARRMNQAPLASAAAR
jgi:hypothetical protein